jgi:hypothetical protein
MWKERQYRSEEDRREHNIIKDRIEYDDPNRRSGSERRNGIERRLVNK